MIKHQTYLTKTGIGIFKEIVKALKVGQEIDTFELSMLANAYDIYQRYAHKLKEIEDTKYIESQRLAAIMDKAFKQIDKQSDKYGMTPIGRDKLSKISTGIKKTSNLDKYN